MSMLLRVSTQHLSVEIRGPKKFPFITVEHPPTPRVVALADLETLVWLDEEESVNPSDDNPAPALYEDTIYRLYVRSLDGSPVSVWHRDASLIANLDSLAAQQLIAGPINFGRQVGLTDFIFTAGQHQLRLSVEVFPSKVDYATDYEDLIREVSGIAKGLSLEYFRATYRVGRLDRRALGSSLEWITILRASLTRIESALLQIERQPERALHTAIVEQPSHKLRGVNAGLLRAVARGAGSGPLQRLNSGLAIHTRLPARAAISTLNTPEHRWLRVQLRATQLRLTRTTAQLQEMAARSAQRRSTGGRLTLEIAELQDMSARVAALSNLTFITEAIGSVPESFSSLQLLTTPGYGDAYRAFKALGAGLNTEAGETPLSLMDVNDLYETWCFIEIVRLSAEVTGAEVDLGEVLQLDQSGIRFALAKGKNSTVKLRTADVDIALSYNPSFGGLTGTQRPDIVISIARAGWPDLIVVLDAKYRVDGSSEYIRQFKMIGPPVDAINVLHRYRDAIVVDSRARSGPKRPVVKGAALFPLSALDSARFHESKLSAALEQLGIGAIPFLPSNTGLVREWLQALFALSPAELALPGPAFVGLEALAERA
jgi:hypothetical protein